MKYFIGNWKMFEFQNLLIYLIKLILLLKGQES